MEREILRRSCEHHFLIFSKDFPYQHNSDNTNARLQAVLACANDVLNRKLEPCEGKFRVSFELIETVFLF